MSISLKRAPFVVIEGLDRSGKTTQTTRLYDRLKEAGVAVELIKFPDRTTAIGKMIDSYLRSTSELDDRAIHLLFSANRWELASTIEKHLNAGTAVICDRYAFSGIAFSASKITPTGEPALSFEWCLNPEKGLPAPDLVLFLDITPEIARKRGGYGQERYEKEEMQFRVRKLFQRIGGDVIAEKRDGKVNTTWEIVDAGRERDIVGAELWSLVQPLVNGVESQLARLWI
ncbi:thymidylate kinase-domain-containing protein [Crepidotus variabilis]|uniref:Thymidylate kinase n=1 Tax=Crepidotus variabilis TaxID=179855 RepID=A0A9P6EIC1_9AGAR|nr:thymidylate kinase-domain-containing protein [Crepidotus variabilis]